MTTAFRCRAFSIHFDRCVILLAGNNCPGSCEDPCPVARPRVHQLSEALLYIYLSCDCQHFFPVEILIAVTMVISGQLTHLFEKGAPALIVLVVHEADDLPPRFCWVWRWERSAELTPLTPENEGCSVPTVSGNKHRYFMNNVQYCTTYCITTGVTTSVSTEECSSNYLCLT